jgi:hypothetical protein
MARTSRSSALAADPHSEQRGSKLRALAFQSSQDMISRNLASATLISVCGVQRHSNHHANNHHANASSRPRVITPTRHHANAWSCRRQHAGPVATPATKALSTPSPETPVHGRCHRPRALKATGGETYWGTYFGSCWENLLGGPRTLGHRAMPNSFAGPGRPSEVSLTTPDLPKYSRGGRQDRGRAPPK